MDVLVSAHNPMTGARHLGHHVSTMREWPKLQDRYECFFVIDDLIATFMYPKIRKDLFNRTLLTARDFLACGIDTSRSHLVFTSMLWENSELLMLLSNYVDEAFCRNLYKHSFLGLLSHHHRVQLSLPLHPSVAEHLYPQLALPALTIGLGATQFQGGEEISGYVYIIEEIVKRFNAEHGSVLKRPEWNRPSTTFLIGTDGNHMMADNALTMSTFDYQDRSNESIPAHVLDEWAEALGGQSKGGRGKAAGQGGSTRAAVMEMLEEECARYRNFDITSEQILDIATKGAGRAKALLRQTLSGVKQAMAIPEIVEYS